MIQQKIVIIAAGGTGSRLNANLPKQYMLLNGRPVLMHTIEAFVDIVDQIWIAIHPKMITYWKELCNEYNFTIPHQLIAGGDTRFQSVQNTILHLNKILTEEEFKNSYIAVHDAARPLVDTDLIKESYRLASLGINNTLAVKSTNSIRIGNRMSSNTIDRNTVWQIQTPQTFPATILYTAYQQKESNLFTDDCSVVESMGQSIQIIESTNKNIKLTFAEDFDIAHVLINRNSNN